MQHAAGRNHAPQMAPAVIVKVQGEQNVQTLAGLAFVDDELDRLVRERRVTRDIGQMLTYLSSARPASDVRASLRELPPWRPVFGRPVFGSFRLRNVRLRRFRFRGFGLRWLPLGRPVFGGSRRASVFGDRLRLRIPAGSVSRGRRNPRLETVEAFTGTRLGSSGGLSGKGPRLSQLAVRALHLGLGVYWARAS